MGRLAVGSAPDSWGVWFADDPQQTPWERFLDEVAEAGYARIELGPYGYLPTDAVQLGDELGRRGLELTAGTISEQLHRAGSWEATWRDASAVARLTAALGGKHLVVIPASWRHPSTGLMLEPARLDDAGWARHSRQLNELGKRVADEFGLRTQVHPHADTHIDTPENIERLLAETDPAYVNLCLDTGHLAYCGGDNLQLIRDHPDRIRYVHLKQVDPVVLGQVQEEALSFGEAVRRGVMCEPPKGVPDLPPVLAALAALEVDLFAIVEQDLYPCAPDVPLPIAARTLTYLRTQGGVGLA